MDFSKGYFFKHSVIVEPKNGAPLVSADMGLHHVSLFNMRNKIFSQEALKASMEAGKNLGSGLPFFPNSNDYFALIVYEIAISVFGKDNLSISNGEVFLNEDGYKFILKGHYDGLSDKYNSDYKVAVFKLPNSDLEAEKKVATKIAMYFDGVEHEHTSFQMLFVAPYRAIVATLQKFYTAYFAN